MDDREARRWKRYRRYDLIKSGLLFIQIGLLIYFTQSYHGIVVEYQNNFRELSRRYAVLRENCMAYKDDAEPIVFKR
jgi:hypothetical protein